jgi:hypothetical protein
VHYNDLCIYKYKNNKAGMTSSMAETMFTSAAQSGNLFCVDSAAFNNIIDHARKRKYAPMKFGDYDRFLFCYGHYNHEQHQILIDNNRLIIDYTAHTSFLIDRAEDTIYLKNLINWVNQQTMSGKE